MGRKVITKKYQAITPAEPTKLQLQNEIERMNDSYRCNVCGSFKNISKFYTSSDPMIKTGVTPICKECAMKIAERINNKGVAKGATQESVIKALQYVDRPFSAVAWDKAVEKSKDSGLSIWSEYIKFVSGVSYKGMTFFDSDFFKLAEKNLVSCRAEDEFLKTHAGDEIYDNYKKNKADVIRLLDYDPFESESLEDQPFLYSQLLGLIDIDEESSVDMLRISSAITIVRGFLQQSKIDDTITKLMSDSFNIQNNSATIRSLQDSKIKIISMITSLAAENCLSLKNNKKVSKGDNTWTGKLKKIHELNLREGQNNGFDIRTCKGMQQVQEISDASIMKQLKLDDSEWSDIVAEMRVTNNKLRKERDKFQEINRLLLKENLDLKDELKKDGNDIKSDCVNLKEIYSIFSEEEDEDANTIIPAEDSDV